MFVGSRFANSPAPELPPCILDIRDATGQSVRTAGAKAPPTGHGPEPMSATTPAPPDVASYPRNALLASTYYTDFPVPVKGLRDLRKYVMARRIRVLSSSKRARPLLQPLHSRPRTCPSVWSWSTWGVCIKARRQMAHAPPWAAWSLSNCLTVKPYNRCNLRARFRSRFSRYHCLLAARLHTLHTRP